LSGYLILSVIRDDHFHRSKERRGHAWEFFLYLVTLKSGHLFTTLLREFIMGP